MAVVDLLQFRCGVGGIMTVVVLLLLVVRCWRCFVVIFFVDGGGGVGSRKSNHTLYSTAVHCRMAMKIMVVMVTWQDNRS